MGHAHFWNREGSHDSILRTSGDLGSESRWSARVRAAYLPRVATAADEPVGGGHPPAQTGGEVLKIHLMDGSQIGGRLAARDIEVETQFGKLTIPVAAIVSLTPGLASHPQVGQNIDTLIERLGSPVFSEREAAQKALAAMGPSVRLKLAPATEDADTERRTRVKTILEEFDAVEEDSESDEPSGPHRLIDRDTIETTDFTVVGRIVQQEFDISSQYGTLKVKLSDIARIAHNVVEKQDIVKTVNIGDANLISRGLKDTGIRIDRGDRVTLAADGTITMTPWGNQAVSTPEGVPNFGWYQPNKIATGTLVGKIGPNGPVFRIGSKHTLTADRSGVLQLAIAMPGDQQNQAFPGEYRAKIRVKRK